MRSRPRRRLAATLAWLLVGVLLAAATVVLALGSSTPRPEERVTPQVATPSCLPEAPSCGPFVSVAGTAIGPAGLTTPPVDVGAPCYLASNSRAVWCGPFRDGSYGRYDPATLDGGGLPDAGPAAVATAIAALSAFAGAALTWFGRR